MDIIDIAIAKSKATAVDPSDISSAVSDYLDEHGVQVETDSTLSHSGQAADAGAVGNAMDSLIDTFGVGIDLLRQQVQSNCSQIQSNIDAHLNSWEEVYSFWQAGYYYDGDNNYAYTQIDADERAWSVMVVRDTTYCTPNDKLIPVITGEHYKVNGSPVYMDSKKHFVPSVIFFDSSQNPVNALWLRATVGDPDRSEMEFTIPSGVEYMAVVGISHIYKKVHKSINQFNILNSINSHYNLYKTKKQIPKVTTFNKGYICIGTDDIRNDHTKHLHDMFTEYNIPYYMAVIPVRAKFCVTDAPYHTNLDYMQMCVDNGGEIVVHNADAISASNANDFDFLYQYFCKQKEELEFYGFSPKGIYKAGATNAIDTNTAQYEAWVSYYYNFSDLFSPTNAYPYRMERQCLEWLTEANIDALVTKICVNHEPVNFFTHSNEGDARFAYLMEKLSEYTEDTDYEFVTPSELYEIIMSSSSSSDITVDTELNASSTNPVTNSAIYAAIGDIESALQALR